MKITSGMLVEKLRLALDLASAIDPKIALASAGLDALSGLFGATGDVKGLMELVMAETNETAPEVAQKVSEMYTRNSDSVKTEFSLRPGVD